MEEEFKKIIEGFKGVATASVSDAVDKVVGRRGFMSHEIKPIFPCKIVGPAVTILNEEALVAAPPRLAMEAMENASPGDVLVLVIDGGKDVAGWGGLMTAGAIVKELAGTILDCGTRDVIEIEEARYPVFARSIVPSTTPGRYVTSAVQVPVICGGVRVNPGDIIVGDRDGVVVVPREQAAKVLETALAMEETERQMAREIYKRKSLLKAFEHFRRI